MLSSLLQVFFQPLSNVIITCFKDDSVHAWDAATMDYLYHLPPPPLPPCYLASSPRFRAFATTEVRQGLRISMIVHYTNIHVVSFNTLIVYSVNFSREKTYILAIVRKRVQKKAEVHVCLCHRMGQ